MGWIVFLLIVIITLIITIGITLGYMASVVQERELYLSEWRRVESRHEELIIKIQNISDVKIERIWRDSVEIVKVDTE